MATMNSGNGVVLEWKDPKTPYVGAHFEPYIVEVSGDFIEDDGYSLVEKKVYPPSWVQEYPSQGGKGRYYVLWHREDPGRPGFLQSPGMACTDIHCPCLKAPWRPDEQGQLEILPCALVCEVCGLWRRDFSKSAGNLRRHVREQHVLPQAAAGAVIPRQPILATISANGEGRKGDMLYEGVRIHYNRQAR